MGLVNSKQLATQVLGGLLALGISQAGSLAQAQPLLEAGTVADNGEHNVEQNVSQTALQGLIPGTGDGVAPQQALESPLETADVVEPAKRLVLSLSERRVRLYQGDAEISSYPVAVGKAGWETPKGEFSIYQKVMNPTWRHPWNGSLVPPGPQNPLGQRWVGFLDRGSEAFGFHGTTDESLIGQAVSHGCVRMKNADIEALFEQIDVGTVVTVQQ